MRINSLDNEQRRQLIDTQQIFEGFEEKRRIAEARYGGSMRWKEQSGTTYLLRKQGQRERSLGPRSPETERIYRQFVDGRERISGDLKALEETLGRLAKVNVALGLGRVPMLTARLLRRLGDARLLGSHLHVVGTNALFAYEAKAGVRFESGLLATGDADLLMDARRRLRLAMDNVRKEGVLGVLRKVDRSFEPRGPRDFRAINRNGFYVDLIRAETADVMSRRVRDRIGEADDDLYGSPIAGLNWLVHAPKLSAIAVDEAGFPVRIDAVDPRAFALHKAWVSKRPDRDPIKKSRDWDQARAVAELAAGYLGMSFDSDDLTALPRDLCDEASVLLQGVEVEDGQDLEAGKDDHEPKWW